MDLFRFPRFLLSLLHQIEVVLHPLDQDGRGQMSDLWCDLVAPGMLLDAGELERQGVRERSSSSSRYVQVTSATRLVCSFVRVGDGVIP